MRIVGQERCKRALSIAAKSKRDVILFGSPGRGKSLMATAYCAQFASVILTVQGCEVEEHLEIIRAHQAPCVIDEVHDARGTAIISIIDDANRTCAPLALTTTEDACFSPMVSRCFIAVLEEYTNPELGEIIIGVAPSMSETTRLALARLSRGSPRRAKLFGEMLQSMIASSKNCQPGVELDDAEVHRLMAMVGYPCGLTLREVELMRNLRAGPKSRFSLSGALGCKPSSLWAIESFTISSGLTSISSRGRCLTDIGREVLSKIERIGK